MTVEVDSKVELPAAAELRTLLDGLFDKPVKVQSHPSPVMPGRDVRVVGAYVDGSAAVRAVVFTDLTVGSALGAALALVPAQRVQEAVNAGAVPEDLADNTREVLNVAASLFNCGDAHLKLGDVWVAPQPVGDDAVVFLRAAAQRSDITVEVPGYGSGVVALLVL